MTCEPLHRPAGPPGSRTVPPLGKVQPKKLSLHDIRLRRRGEHSDWHDESSSPFRIRR